MLPTHLFQHRLVLFIFARKLFALRTFKFCACSGISLSDCFKLSHFALVRLESFACSFISHSDSFELSHFALVRLASFATLTRRRFTFTSSLNSVVAITRVAQHHRGRDEPQFGCLNFRSRNKPNEHTST